MGSEIIFEVTEDADGGFCAVALGHAIATQGETMEELRNIIVTGKQIGRAHV